jgi:hypothetical protein
MISKKKYSLALAGILVLFPVSSALAFDSALYGKLIKKYLYPGKVIAGIRVNAVDYRGLYREKQNQASDYSRLLKGLARFNPASLPDRNARIAFWINTYNIGALKLILDNYPVDSIRSMKINLFTSPWKIKVLKINGRDYSLHEIEHVILLGRYGRKDIHFGIVCASVSCPDLTPVVFTGKNLDRLLKERGEQFLSNRRKGLRIDREGGRVFVSRIFKYDSKSFSRGSKDIIPFILPYVKDSNDRDYLRRGGFCLEFMNYNWKLNSLYTVP